MRRLTTGSLIAATAALAALGLSTTPASAATTWTVSPGGSYSGTAGTTTLTDNATGQGLTCTGSTASGTLQSGSGLSGNGIGNVSAISFSNCTGPLGITFSVSTNAPTAPWALNAQSYSSGVTTGTLTGIHASISGATCTADVDGPSGDNTASGSVNISYNNSNDQLTVSGGNLTIYNASGCLGVINSGDTTSFSGVYAVSPGQSITSP